MTVLPSFVFGGNSNFANSDGFSWYERALAKRYPYMRLNSAGQGLAVLTAPNVLAQIEGHKDGVIQMGTNNFGSPVAANLALLQAGISAFREHGIQRVTVCTLPPSTTSNDSYATASGQSSSPGTSPNREDLNDAIRDMALDWGGENADVIFDGTSYVEVDASNVFTRNGKKWAIKTAPGHGTPSNYGDGPHFGEYGMAATAVGGAVLIDRLASGDTNFLLENPDMGT